MKKILFLVFAMVFFAAACNNEQPPASTNNTNQTSGASAKVDAAVNDLYKDMDAESSLNMQSDTDIVNSDQTVINSYNGVSNASSY